MMSMNLGNIAILSCIVSLIRKGEAMKLFQNIDLN